MLTRTASGGHIEGGRVAVATKLRPPRTEPSHDASHRSGRIVAARQRD
jgi:hypothetical protein